MTHIHEISAKVWRYTGKAGWHFVTLPKDLSHEIRQSHVGRRRGWGSVPVRVTLGNVRWKTSIFPDAKHDAYLLPLKAEIRKKAKVEDGDELDFLLEIR